MGYDFHITRRKDWSEEGNDITVEEWLKLVESDPELRLNPANGPYVALWNGKSKNPEPWLDWDDGQIFTKNPDRALFMKMLAIAGKLSAKVQGDDGEEYASAKDFDGANEVSAEAKAMNRRGTVVTYGFFAVVFAMSIGIAIIGDGWKQKSIGIVAGIFWLVILLTGVKPSRR